MCSIILSSQDVKLKQELYASTSMAPSTTISVSPNQQHSQATSLQGSGSPAQSPISAEFDQFDSLDFLPALTGDADEEDEDSSGPSNDTADVHNRDRANKIVRFLLKYADKDLLSQTLYVGPEVRGQGSRKRRREAENEDVQATLSSQEEDNRNAEAIEVRYVLPVFPCPLVKV